MSELALSDLFAALALVLVAEGLVLAVFSRRLPRLMEQIQSADPERMRWAGLGMAVMGTAGYLAVRL